MPDSSTDACRAEATYYDRVVSDLLFFRPLPTSTGFSRQFYPIGSMSNKGIELMFRTTNLDRPNLQWTSTMTYAHNKNLVDTLDDPGLSIGGRLSEPHSRRASRLASSTVRTRRAIA